MCPHDVPCFLARFRCSALEAACGVSLMDATLQYADNALHNEIYIRLRHWLADICPDQLLMAHVSTSMLCSAAKVEPWASTRY